MPSYESVSQDVRKLSGRAVRVTFERTELPREEMLMKAVLAARLGLFSDLIGTSPSARESFSRLRRTILSLSEIMVERYAQDWACLKEAYLSNLSSFYGRGSDELSAFKQQTRGRIHYKWIRDSVIALMEEGACESAVIQWIVFDEKLNFRSLDLTDRHVHEYVESERIMRTWSYPEIPVINEIVEEWFSGFCLQIYPFLPKHGGGATAEVKRREASWDLKNTFLSYDERLLDWVKIRDVSNIDPEFWFFAGRGTVNRTAVMQCVPKSMVKNRVISAEPTVLQYLQQDLFQTLDSFFQKHQVLRHHVDMHDQDRSRRACRRASEYGELDSIDLSAASDSVTLPLLQHLFGNVSTCQDLLAGLTATRSTHVQLPDGSVLELTKYGGMGNGTTFPIETLVFAILCEAAVRLGCGRRSNSDDYYVYGDDILINQNATQALMRLLQAFHFKVNESKSFSTTTGRVFREACGMWALQGEEITPLRLSRRLYYEDLSTPSEAYGWIHLYNESLRYAYLDLRRTLNAILSQVWWFHRLLRVGLSDARAEHDGWCVVTFDGNATNWHAPVRWAGVRTLTGRGASNAGYHVTQVRCTAGQSRRTDHPVSEESRFFSWMLRSLCQDREREDIAPIEARTPAASVLKWTEKWVQR